MPRAIEAPLGLADAVGLLAADPDRMVVAGGTDLVPALHDGRVRADRLLSLDRLREVHGAGRTANGGLFLGAALTCTELAGLDAVLPALARAATGIGPPGVRNAATVGGNVVSAAGGDLLPVLMAVRAAVVLESAAGRREIGVEQFLSPVADTGRPDLRPGELLAGLRIEHLPADTRFARLTVPGRRVLVLALARDAHAPEIRVAVCAGGRVPVRAAAAEKLIGAELRRTGRDIAAATVTAFGHAVGAAAGAAASAQADYVRHAAQICAQRLLARMVGDD
jgi:CO/xanthine dehydrogenase FAD-binding subunit